MALTVWSLLRGVVAFLRTTREGWSGDEGIREMQLQNRMMFNRIKFQGLAIVVVIVLLMVAGKN
jgi:uncharacterized membrane protein YecN with MAPEG domain